MIQSAPSLFTWAIFRFELGSVAQHCKLKLWEHLSHQVVYVKKPFNTVASETCNALSRRMVGVYPWVYHGSVQLGNTWALLKSAKGFTSKSTRRSKFGAGEPSKSGLASVLAGGALEAASPEGAVLELGFWFSEACRSKADVTSFASDSKSSIFFKPAGWLLEYLFLMRSGILNSNDCCYFEKRIKGNDKGLRLKK